MMIGSVSVPMNMAGNQRKASVNNTTATFKGTKSWEEFTSGWINQYFICRCIGKAACRFVLFN